MFFYLYKGFGVYIKFETKRGSLVFLTGSYDYAFRFFSGCKHIRFFLHQPDTSLRLSVMLPLFLLQFSHLCQEMNHQQTESF